MSGFSNQFQAHLVPSHHEIAEAMREGLVVLDTNVLLNAYRFAPKARDELLSVLEKVSKRVWIPHQVGLEFHRNRFAVIAEHDTAYKELLDTLDEHRKNVQADLDAKVRKLSNRSALTDDVRDQLLDLSRQTLEPLRREVARLHQAHGLGSPADSDEVINRLQSIFPDSVGPAFSEDERRNAEEEASRRIEDKVPPGFKDSRKLNPNGDYFLWAQTLAEAERRRPKFLVLVTGDVKEDWYLRVKGQTIIGRPELADEIEARTGARLILMPTDTFLHHAQEYLNASVSTDTLAQAGRVAEAHLLRAAVEDARRLQDERERLAAALEAAGAEHLLSRKEAFRLSTELGQISDRSSPDYLRLEADLAKVEEGRGKLQRVHERAQARWQELNKRLHELETLIFKAVESTDYESPIEETFAEWLGRYGA
ncbi:PIN-like domain-containing protein [Micromonospora sp. NPDC005203]|uniref:PIN-like domain-containing protein n=1 Tax=Micromonospora sp. NPDC005203 TaxID=3364226 RepID=UPI0036AA8902